MKQVVSCTLFFLLNSISFAADHSIYERLKEDSQGSNPHHVDLIYSVCRRANDGEDLSSHSNVDPRKVVEQANDLIEFYSKAMVEKPRDNLARQAVSFYTTCKEAYERQPSTPPRRTRHRDLA